VSGVPQMKVEHLVNGSWIDVSSRVPWGDSGGPVQMVRGMADGGNTLIGTASLVLDNSDGGITPRKVPYLTRYRPVRISAYINSAWRARHYGYLTAEPLSFGDEQGQVCLSTWSTIDLFGMAALKPLRSVAVESVAARSPLAYYPLTDGVVSLADQSSYARPTLDKQVRGTGGDPGAGTTLPTDTNAGLLFSPANDSNGAYFQSGEGFDLPASWSLSVWISPAAKDGYVCQVGTDSYSLGIWYDTSTKKLSAIETKLDSNGDPIDYVLSTSSSAWSPGIETMTVTSTTVKLGSSSTTGTRHGSTTMKDSLVSVGSAFAVESGRARLFSGEVKHLAFWAGAYPSGATAEILTGPTSMRTMSTAIAQVLTWAGLGTITVTTSGTDQPVALQQTDGPTALDVINNYATGSLARIFCDGSGGVQVVAFDATPTTVTATGGLIDPQLEWASEPDGDVTDVTMTWPDGTTYTVSETAVYRSSASLPGALPGDVGRSVADWTLSASDGAPAFRAASYDLLTIPDADMYPLALMAPADTLTVPGLPSQLPAASQSATVMQIVETVAVGAWIIQLALESDTRDRLFIVGDATRGVVGAGYLAGPLASPVAGQWKAGDEISAANLNGRGFPGGQMQTGTVTITPVANTPTSTTVTFPTAFATTPVVVASASSAVPGSEVKEVSVSSVTTTGFTAWIYRTNTTDSAILWIAAVN